MRDPRLEEFAGILELSGDYTVLRRLLPRSVINEPDGSEQVLAIALDTETTGLDPKRDEIIELCMLPFTFSPSTGRIFTVGEPFVGLRQPAGPISAEITAITGIDDAMVAGHAMDPGEIAHFVAPAAVIIAHHAAFDRPFAESFHDSFKLKCWACSMTEIDWRAEGYESNKLAWLLAGHGLFYGRHRAAEDCRALVELLALPLPKSGVLALAKLLDAARQPTWRIWAQHSPFEMKEELKARGYQWSNGDDGRPKSWFIDLGTAVRDAEVEWLRANVYKTFRHTVEFRIDRITAYERFTAPTRG